LPIVFLDEHYVAVHKSEGLLVHRSRLAHHPLIGDSHYGKGSHNRLFRSPFGVPGLLLCAWRPGFEHPYQKRWSCIRAIRDPAWDRLMAALGWSDL